VSDPIERTPLRPSFMFFPMLQCLLVLHSLTDYGILCHSHINVSYRLRNRQASAPSSRSGELRPYADCQSSNFSTQFIPSSLIVEQFSCLRPMSYFVLRVLVESTKRCYRACVGSQYASEKNPAAGSTVDLCQGTDLVCLTYPGRVGLPDQVGHQNRLHCWPQVDSLSNVIAPCLQVADAAKSNPSWQLRLSMNRGH